MAKLSKSTIFTRGGFGRFDEFCACMDACGPCGAHVLVKTCILNNPLTSHHVSDDSGERAKRIGSEAPVVVAAL